MNGGRPPSLSKEQAEILANRIFLSRNLGIFSLAQLSDGFEITVATLHRYKSPAYRQSSRDYSKRAYLSYRKSLHQGVCYRCHEELEHHARCVDCEILLHVGSTFGDTRDGVICTGCFDTRINRKMKHVQVESTD